jgi:hypothetical protein
MGSFFFPTNAAQYLHDNCLKQRVLYPTIMGPANLFMNLTYDYQLSCFIAALHSRLPKTNMLQGIIMKRSFDDERTPLIKRAWRHAL